jgi:hypothetical protein
MNLTSSEKSLIEKIIRKERRFSFKQKMIIWGIVSAILSCLLPLSFFFGKAGYTNTTLFFWLVAITFCSSNYLFNIIKKYDDEYIKQKTKHNIHLE